MAIVASVVRAERTSASSGRCFRCARGCRSSYRSTSTPRLFFCPCIRLQGRRRRADEFRIAGGRGLRARRSLERPLCPLPRSFYQKLLERYRKRQLTVAIGPILDAFEAGVVPAHADRCAAVGQPRSLRVHERVARSNLRAEMLAVRKSMTRRCDPPDRRNPRPGGWDSPAGYLT